MSLLAVVPFVIVVGADGEDGNQSTITNGTTSTSDMSAFTPGAAYVYVRTGTTWSQQAYLKSANMASAADYGKQVSISGDTIVVGAEQEGGNQTTITNGTTATTTLNVADSGAAFVYKRTGNDWAQEAYLKPPNNNTHFHFGRSVSIKGDVLAIGTMGDDSNQTTITNGTTASSDTSENDVGAAYVFIRSGTQWNQQAYIKPPIAHSNTLFGGSIALYDDTIAVGAAEDSNQTTITNGTTASSDNSSSDSGAAYVFRRTGTDWSQEAFIKMSNSDQDDLAYIVALYKNTLVVGAMGESSNQTTITLGNNASADNSSSDAGAVYVFERTGSTWEQTAYLKPTNNTASDRFGARVAITEDRIYVTSIGEDSNQTTITNGTTASSDNSSNNSGAVYVFRRNTNE